MPDYYGYERTLSEYVILIAFPQQQMLNERASMICYMYAACPVVYVSPMLLRVSFTMWVGPAQCDTNLNVLLPAEFIGYNNARHAIQFRSLATEY